MQTISICLPTYKGSSLLTASLKTIVSQSYENIEILIGDDNGNDEIESEKVLSIIKSFESNKITYFKNKKNLGYPENLKSLVSKTNGDIIFLFAQDDLLASNSLKLIRRVFDDNPEVGVITRPYFWFAKDWSQPIRALTPYDDNKDTILDLRSAGWFEFYKIFESVGQLSGLAFRKSCLDVPFHHEIFPAHIYPFASILKKYKCMYLKDYIVAVGTEDSQTRLMSSIYDSSPALAWIKMYQAIFDTEEFKKFKKFGIKHACTNYLGLLQIKCHSNFFNFIREIWIMISYRPIILFNLKFILIVCLCLCLPKTSLRKLIDYFKNKINSNFLPKISFKPSE